MRALRCGAIAGLALAALAALAAGAPPASAASSYDSCTGSISALPAVISKPGIWCLQQDVVSIDAYKAGIEVDTDNVTIDCNGFSLSNLPAGIGTRSIGVLAWGFSNIAVRNCMIQGFLVGMWITGSAPGAGRPPGSGHVIENNRLSRNRYKGIEVIGFGSLIRGNIVAHTGGRPDGGRAWGIRALGGVDVIDNVVDGIVDDGIVTAFQSIGIFISDFAGYNPDITSNGVRLLGNRVRNLMQKDGSASVGIAVTGSAIEIRDNHIAQATATYGAGVGCWGADARVRDNVIKNYSTGIDATCTDQGGNVAY